MIHLQKPENFHPKFEVASCFLEYEDKILLLQRQDHKSEPNTFWVPAGKIEDGEMIIDTVIREVFEETGLDVDEPDYLEKVYVRYPTYDFVFHMYIKKLLERPQITINTDEHKGYIWRSPREALQENLIQDEDLCIELCYGL